MAYEYKKYGATTDGYRGDRAILDERVIEGFDTPAFTSSVLKLTAESAQTIHLTNDNVTSDSHYIVLPDATTLPKNWRITIINDSDYKCAIYRNNISDQELLFFKEVSKGNMTTCILLGNDDIPGEWTTLRTVEEISTDDLDKFTTDVLDSIKINYTQLLEDNSSATIRLSNILTGTALKSVYVKTDINFEGAASAKLSIGTADDHTKFLANYDLLAAVSDNTFSKDYFNEILSINEDKVVYAYITGSSLSSLTSGEVTIVIEKAETVDPTILSNPIIQSQIPLGIIMNYAFDDVPEGFWRLDGTVIPNAQAAIPKFVNKLLEVNNRLPGEKIIVGIDQWNSIYNTYGSCGKFAWSGTGLKFPSINCFVKGIDLTNISQLSGITEAGLPNITGNFHLSTNTENTGLLGYTQGTGSFRANETSVANYIAQRSTSFSTGNRGWNFDASRSSNVFGKSSTVTPLHVKYPYIISIYHKIQDSAEIRLDQIVEDSVYKANVNLDNLSPEGEAKFVYKANVNLDNLSPEGEAKFVKTTGSTMTGRLLVDVEGEHFTAKDTNLDRSATTSVNKTGGYFSITDNNNRLIGRLYAGQTDAGYNVVGIHTISDTSTDVQSHLRVLVKQDGTRAFAAAPTPVGTASGTEVVTAAWARDQLVAKSGSTMTGTLSFDKHGIMVSAKDNQLDRTAYPQEDVTGGIYRVFDKNNLQLASLYAGIGTNGSIRCSTGAVDGDGTIHTMGVITSKDGSEAHGWCPTAPLNVGSNQIATAEWVRNLLAASQSTGLAQYSKNATGYIKFSNGIIMQWGIVTLRSNSANISFPISFTSSTSYQISASKIDNNSTVFHPEHGPLGFASKTKDGIVVGSDVDYGSIYDCTWIAIGY